METPEVVVLAVGASMVYLLCAAFAGCLPIRHGGVRALAMALWPVSVVAVLIYLPFLIWSAAADDSKSQRERQVVRQRERLP